MQVDYIFSDKTGTLTSNEMQMRLLAIKGTVFGTTDFKCADFFPISRGLSLSLGYSFWEAALPAGHQGHLLYSRPHVHCSLLNNQHTV